jgi:hypothetical protein
LEELASREQESFTAEVCFLEVLQIIIFEKLRSSLPMKGRDEKKKRKTLILLRLATSHLAT